jgi:transcriptional regulator with XRE-family HTH domain
MTIHRTSLSAAILSIRTRLDISQAELGKILSVWPNTVSRWERGQVAPSPWQLLNLYRHARTEEELGPILQTLGSKGIALKMGAGAEAHEISIPPSGEACNV